MHRQSEKNSLNTNISSRCPHSMANFGPLAAEMLGVWATPASFNRSFASWLSYCSDIAHWRPTKLCTTFWPFPGLVQFWGLLPPYGILPRAKFTLHLSFAFLYTGSVTARHSSSGPQPNFAAWYKEWNYGTLPDGATYIQLDGHHVGHWPTF